MLFSIIIPVYKVEDYIARCIESVLCQSMTDFEIILVDDGSPDNCPAICDRYAEKDKRIKIVHKINGGLSDARNAGLMIAEGEYVLFLDSDDWLKQNALECFKKEIEMTKADIVVGNLINEDGSRYISKQKVVVGKSYSGRDYYLTVNGNIPICAVTSAYKRHFLLSRNLFFLKGRFHEDCEFSPRAYLLANNVVYTNIEHYVRFERNDSITTHLDKRKNLLDILDIANRIFAFSNSFNYKIKRCLRNTVCKSYLGIFVDADVFQYKHEQFDRYVDKRIVVLGLKNVLRKALFVLSPRLYVFFAKKRRKKHGSNH